MVGVWYRTKLVEELRMAGGANTGTSVLPPSWEKYLSALGQSPEAIALMKTGP
jgi:hypothetical protein